MRIVATTGKVVVICALLWFILDRIAFKELVSKVHPKEIAIGVLVGVVVVVIQALIYALRLRTCLRILGCRVSFAGSGVVTLLGGLFNHTPFSFVGGDAVRVWRIAGYGVSLTDATKGVILDRVMGFIGMMCMAIVTAPMMISAMNRSPLLVGYTTMMAACLVAILGFLLAGRIPSIIPHRGVAFARAAEFASLSRYLTRNPRSAMSVLGLSIIANLFNVIALWLISGSYGFEIGAYPALIASPTIFLVAMMPVSFSGWGLREGAAIATLGLFGISAEQALTVSVTIGFATALAYAPGLALVPSIWKRGGINGPKQRTEVL